VQYLADTSALVRIWRKQADRAWEELGNRGLIAICEPVLIEVLLAAESKQYAAIEADFRESYVVATVPDSIWNMTAAIRRLLAAHSEHLGLSVADLVIAATALRLKLTVLHEDGDFETIARHVPELRQHRISALPA
jgi:predicted nucleic acid-binding protein